MPTIQRSYKFRIAPTPAQAQRLARDFGSARWAAEWSRSCADAIAAHAPHAEKAG
jgi:hypothetical protein